MKQDRFIIGVVGIVIVVVAFAAAMVAPICLGVIVTSSSLSQGGPFGTFSARYGRLRIVSLGIFWRGISLASFSCIFSGRSYLPNGSKLVPFGADVFPQRLHIAPFGSFWSRVICKRLHTNTLGLNYAPTASAWHPWAPSKPWLPGLVVASGGFPAPQLDSGIFQTLLLGSLVASGGPSYPHIGNCYFSSPVDRACRGL